MAVNPVTIPLYREKQHSREMRKAVMEWREPDKVLQGLQALDESSAERADLTGD